MRTAVIDTSLGPVEVALTSGAGDTVLFFPGGHTTAATPLGTDIYTDLGYRVLTFSRPGHGLTDVGELTAAEFIPAIAQVCNRPRSHCRGRDRGTQLWRAAGRSRRGPPAAPRSTTHPAQLRTFITALSGHLSATSRCSTPVRAPLPVAYMARGACPDVFGQRPSRHDGLPFETARR
jgi:hypothetical protein